eukprot:11666309-Alexandrium_andersonii.AAC.1
MAFAQVIMRELQGNYVLEREDKEVLVVQWFHEQRCIWKRAGGARRLRRTAYDVLNKVALPSASLEEDDEPPAIYGDTHFLNSVVNELKCNLPAGDEFPILDDNSRYKIMFRCGLVLDCLTGDVRRGTPQDRISKHTGYDYPPFEDAGIKALIHRAVTRLNEFWEACDGEFKPVYDQEDLAPLLDELLARSPMYKVFFGMFEDHDLA